MNIPLWLVILRGCGKVLLEVPIIHRALENWLEGTTTKIDDRLWAIIESTCQISQPEERKAAVLSSAAQVQEEYNEAKALLATGEAKDKVEAFSKVVGIVMPWMEAITED